MTKQYVQHKTRGFTLIELLVTIAVVSVLAGTLIFFANPGEALRKARDTQRFADLAALTDALTAVASVTSPDLDAAVAAFCLSQGNSDAKIGYSFPVDGSASACASDIAEGADVSVGAAFGGPGGTSGNFCRYSTSAAATTVSGLGWVPVNFSQVPGGAPLRKLPLDPTNKVADTAHPSVSDLVYRYACQSTPVSTGKKNFIFELDAQLESDAYTKIADKRLKISDGGENDLYYETGTSVSLIGAGNNF